MINREATIRWKGYDPDDLSHGSRKRVWANCDDCGDGRWLNRHRYSDLCKSCTKKGKRASPKTISNMSKAHKGISLSDEHIKAQSKAALREKEPLLKGYKIDKDSKTATNKNCATYLGCYIAEQLLIKIFKNVKVMPHNNHGFDFYCGKGLRIDSKSSATGYKGGWSFITKKNIIADYFLCLAFESRNDLTNPSHLWLIPGEDVNHKGSICISKANIQKWSKYEQPLDRVQACCDEMRGK